MPFFLQNVRAEEPHRLFAAGKGLAYYMEPPAQAASPFVTKIAWSGDGSALFAAKLAPSTSSPPLAVAAARQTDGLSGMLKLHPKSQLVAWSRKGKNSRTLLDLDGDRMMIREIDPMPGSDRALILISERLVQPDGTLSVPRDAYVLVSASGAAPVRIYTGPEEATDALVYLSPTRPLGAIVLGENRPTTGALPKRQVVFFGADGRLGQPLTINGSLHFASDGGPIVAITTRKNGKPFREFRRLDLKTGALGAESEPNGWSEAEEKKPVLTVEETKKGIELQVAGGEKDEPGLVTSEGAVPLLSPRNDAVAYLWGQGAYVRGLVKVDRNAYDEALLASEREESMRKAKQAGLAMLMYSSDADDEFPLTGQKDSIYPYLKDRSIVDALTYTYGGGPLNGDPATIELGFVGGPGGRAVIYADGRVVWVPY